MDCKVRKLKIVCITSMIIAIISLFNVKVIVGSPDTTIALTPSPCTGTSGQHIFLSIEVSDVIDLYSWQCQVTYDGTVLDFVREYEGTYLKGNHQDLWESSPWDDSSRGITVTDPHYARDKAVEPNWDNTCAEFTYSEADGRFTIGNCSREPWGTLGAAPFSVVKNVDIGVRYSAAASASGDRYRIVYYSGRPDTVETKIELVGWTSDAASLETHIWRNCEPPPPPSPEMDNGMWDWDDLWHLDIATGLPTDPERGLHFEVETDRVGGDPNADFQLYEAWAIVTFERPTYPAIVSGTGYLVWGVTTLFDYPGISGSGVLGTLEFEVLDDTTDTALVIDYTGTKLENPQGQLITCSKVGTHYYPPSIDEDVNLDGRVDIMDLSWVGINYGKSGGDIQPPRADVNGDGDVTIIDLAMVASKYGYPYT